MIISKLQGLSAFPPRLSNRFFQNRTPDPFPPVLHANRPRFNLTTPGFLPLRPTLAGQPIHYHRPDHLVPELGHEHIRVPEPGEIDRLRPEQVVLGQIAESGEEGHEDARARRAREVLVVSAVVDVAGDEGEDGDADGEVEGMPDQGAVGRLAHLGDAVGCEFQRGDLVVVVVGFECSELWHAGQGVLGGRILRFELIAHDGVDGLRKR